MRPLLIWLLGGVPVLAELSESQYGNPLTEINDPQVRLNQGIVVGMVQDVNYPVPVEAFMGVPYAQPPIGDLRFRRLAPLPRSNDMIIAQEYGSICPGNNSGILTFEEDCLTVNIFRQQGKGLSKKIPVGVYIAGGAFNRGGSTSQDTSSMVAWSENPYIGVSFNYRIGALGFLSSTLGHDEGILNLGLHDQVFLLQWVQDNIEAFGGDKNDVTLFGASAGAHSVGHHLNNYKDGVAPPFHRVIIESGASTARSTKSYNASINEVQFAKFLAIAGCANSLRNSTTSCLRSQPAGVIVNASIAVFDEYNPSVLWPFQPVVDGDIIQRQPIEQWKSGNWNRMPIITGHCTNEGGTFVPAAMSTPEEFTDFFETLLPTFSAQDIATINELYPDPNKSTKYLDTRNLTAIQVGPQFKRVEQAYAQYGYICPARQTAHLAYLNQTFPVWTYQWALNRTVKGGAGHVDNNPYETFSEAVTSIDQSQREVSGFIHTYMTNFITTGNPNTPTKLWGTRPAWNIYDDQTRQFMTFGLGNDERAGGNGTGIAAQMRGSKWITRECDFWWNKTASGV